jgi:choice-of-anchor B domain-containing protein
MTTGIWAEEVTWEIWTLDGTLAAGPFGPYQDETTYTHELCLEAGCYEVLMMDSFGDGWQGAELRIFDVSGSLVDTFGMEAALSSSTAPLGIGGSCGCSEPESVGYDPAASWDDGSCFSCPEGQVGASVVLTTGIWAEELQVTFVDDQNNVAFTGEDLWGPMPWSNNTVYAWEGCLTSECLVAQLVDTFGDGWQGGVMEVQTWSTELGWTSIASGSVPLNEFLATLSIPLDPSCPIPGCMLPEAFNFSPQATVDDGSCVQQSDNVSLFASWSLDDLATNGLGGRYNDVEGLEVNGREYAIVGSTEGTHIVDVTDSAMAVEIHFLPGADGGSFVTHRDYHIHETVLYAVCDQGASTLQIWDLVNLPATPEVLYDDDEFVERAHNVFVDDATMTLYLASSKSAALNTPLLALDVSDPTQPALVADLSPWIGSCHDLYAWDDTVWVNGSGVVRVLDMNPTPHLVGSLDDYPFQGGNHSGWWVPQSKIYVFADETHGSPLKVVDASDVTDLQVLSLLSSETATDAIPHNLMMRDDLVFVSYYHDGLQVFDVRDPANPNKVAWYDTYLPDHHNGFAGAWGVHSALPSGHILISDVQSGLFVLTLEPDSMALCPGDALVVGDLTVDQPGRWVGQAPDGSWFGENILWVEALEAPDCPACTGDFDEDGNLGVSDLQVLLSDLGCQTSCTADLDNDGTVAVSDLLVWLMGFGQPCPNFD